jgi:hypothetical protein
MINLFTVKELVELEKSHNESFTLIRGLLGAIEHSKSRTSMIFRAVCKEKLTKEKNKLMNSENPKIDSKIKQDGGVRPSRIINILFMLILVFNIGDLLRNPESALTANVIMRYLHSTIGTEAGGKIIIGMIRYFTGEKEEPEYPVEYVQGNGVTSLSSEEDVHGRAYKNLKERFKENKKEIEAADSLVSMNKVGWTTVANNLVKCATAGTCTEPQGTMIGLGLRPLYYADMERPKLTVEQLEREEKLKNLEKELETEKRSIFPHIESLSWTSRYFGRERPASKIVEEIKTVIKEIDATNTLKGIISSIPSLSNVDDVSRSLSAVASNVVYELSPPKTLLLGSRRKVSIIGHNESRVVTSEALVAAGVGKFTVKLADIYRHHPDSESEADVMALSAVSKVFDLKIMAQKTVGASTVVVEDKVKKIVDRIFRDDEKEHAIMSFFGRHQLQKSSGGKALVTGLLLEAAGGQASDNARRERDIINEELSKLFDRSIRETINEEINTLTDMIVRLGNAGQKNTSPSPSPSPSPSSKPSPSETIITRSVANDAAGAAIDISRKFGVKPNLDTEYYARAVISCIRGTCAKKPFSELISKADLKREMLSWGLSKRIEHAKYNIIISALFFLSTGAISSTLLETVLGIVGVGGCLARRLTAGDRLRAQAEELEIEDQRITAAQRRELQRARHAIALQGLQNPPPPVAGQGPAGAAPGGPAGVRLIANAAAPAAAPAANHGPAHLRNAYEQAQRNLNVAYNGSRVARVSRNRNAIRQAVARTLELENRRDAARAAYVEAGGVIPRNQYENINLDGGTRRRRR